jgi:hypothetical protein
MGITERVWDALTTVLRMNDKVERMTVTLKSQQDKIENLTERIIRLETALELGLAVRRDRNASGSPP